MVSFPQHSTSKNTFISLSLSSLDKKQINKFIGFLYILTLFFLHRSNLFLVLFSSKWQLDSMLQRFLVPRSTSSAASAWTAIAEPTSSSRKITKPGFSRYHLSLCLWSLVWYMYFLNCVLYTLDFQNILVKVEGISTFDLLHPSLYLILILLGSLYHENILI